MPASRRTFLSYLGLGAVASTLHATTLSAADVERAGRLDPVDEAWDLSWTKKIRGKYRAVFDIPTMVGDPTARAVMWRDQYKKVFGLGDKQLSTVVVVRHQGIAQVMDDAYWNEFNPRRPAAGGRGGGSAVNPTPADSTAPATHSTHGNSGSKEITAFIAAGGIVLACNVAFGMMVADFHGNDARAQAIKHLIPGVILQPSGPFALMRAQDERCHYMMAG
ncbi:MAG TPA: hypothetical protein VGM20_06605 [Gemmatimonadales bacterium]|jgi:hypothetical protein